ncbi:hypothetical protein ACFP3Q_06370 [Nocardioides sp. GCM10027113]|uniref:hypothetical protein n=1 Tax=unclassified Nocardioides TaxID=2615069 RepID=UPI0036113E8C
MSVAATLGVGLVMVANAGGAEPALEPSPPPSTVGQEASPETRLIQRYDCSVTGFGDGRTPQSAIVRTPAGELRVTSFEEGWRVHTGDGPRQLLAVCLHPHR